MRIAILGAGRMGSWLANELSIENDVAVYDLDIAKTQQIENVLVLKEITEVENFKPDMLINMVSLQNTIIAFEQVIPQLPANCIIADMASIKGDLKEYYAKCGKRFVSTHPMFGPTHANMKQLKEHNAIVIVESDKEASEFFRKLYKKLGLRIFEYSFEEHDKMMAYSLGTPFAASMVFAAVVDKKAVPGTNFAKHMILAKGLLAEDNQLLAEVMFNKYTIAELDKITSRLEYLKHIIKARDYQEASAFFDKLRKNIGE
jgi:prephenate dehydrogenase